MKKTIMGGIMAVCGLILGGAAYTFRPPSDLSDVMMMAARGQQVALNQPTYIGAMVLAVVLIAGGIWMIIQSKSKK